MTLARTRPATPEDFELFDSLRERRTLPGHFVGDGLRVVEKMLQYSAVTQILCTPEWAQKLPPLEGVVGCTAPRDRLDKLVGFRLHQGIMALGRIPPCPPLSGSLFVALDDVSNAENVGSILRACAAFGVDAVLVGPTTASPWLRRAIRVSMAAPLKVPIHFVKDLAAAVRPLTAYAAHIHGERVDFVTRDFREPCCIVLGGEANGVSEDVRSACRGVIYIPMAQGWDCLNVASSASVLLAEVQRQRRAT
jgi:tRNA G18 (ribose-2'-O)-methylase SpoU